MVWNAFAMQLHLTLRLGTYFTSVLATERWAHDFGDCDPQGNNCKFASDDQSLFTSIVFVGESRQHWYVSSANAIQVNWLELYRPQSSATILEEKDCS